MTEPPLSNGSNENSRDNGRSQGDWDRYRSYLHLIAQASLGSVLRRKVDASDVVQQTLMQAYEKQDDFRGDDEATRMAWVKRILKNKIIDFARQWQGARRDARRDVALEQIVDDSIVRINDFLAASQTSPSQHAARQEELLQLPAALDQLPADLRDVIVMHHLQGMKLREIAGQIGCDETTVGRRLMRGLKHLKQVMQE